MDAHALAVLEFDKIREQLAARTSFAASRELALALEPSPSRQTVEERLAETAEARLLLQLQPDFSVRRAHDVRAAVEDARLGVVLSPETLLEVRETLESAATVRETIARFAARVPRLAALAEGIDPCPLLVRAIKESIGERGEVLDSASPELGRIRAQLKIAHARLMDALQRLLDEANTRGQVQEPIITMRSGRYVIPIRAESRHQFRGLVHDESASGATVFMEPLGAVDLNNEWRHLQLEEEQEVERVLRHLSALVGQLHDRLLGDVRLLASIDLALAKAKYALALRATAPRLEPGFDFRLIQARHPLLSGDVVPIDLWLGTPAPPPEASLPSASHTPALEAREVAQQKSFIALVITGPNTGGKTVALKTAGLLHLMAQAGLHIPASDGSSIAVFEQIFADIGDEQSIEQSLSTFSSHMGNIVRIIARATERSLVLLDELGAGTDPQEGSALARAILSHLVERGVRTIATTHYSELKAYAYSQPGVQNASVEFDIETLQPTYRLRIGLPGRSNALAIAQRLGLPEPILERARAWLAPAAMEIESLLGAIQAEHAAAREERERAEQLRREVEQEREVLAQRLAEIDDERAATLEQAQREALELLEAARQQIRRAESQLAVAGGSRLAALEAAKVVQQAAQELAARPVARRRARGSGAEQRPIAPGDRVELRRLQTTGRVLAGPDERGFVEVQVGGLRTRANVRELRRLGAAESQETAEEGSARATGYRPARGYGRPAQGPPVQLPVPTAVGMELDVRGTRAEDVLPRVERYLSDAYLSGLPFVRIIHGKGTGVLRQIIRDHLRSNPLVQSFEPAGAAHGGDGATIAKLAV